MITRRRNQRVLHNFIRSNPNRGSIIFSDCWKGYNKLNDLGYIHETVNHKREFVSSGCSIVHTNTIESLWRTLISKVKQSLRFK